MDLGDYRQKLDELDEQLVALFLERMAISREIGKYKLTQGLPIKDAKREAQIIQMRREAADCESDADALEALYKLIFELSRNVQQHK